jgi:hypothetical protein
MFKELPIVLSSAEYYYGSGNPYELIIPYTKKGISLSERNSKFMVIVKDANATTQSIQTELRYTGDVLPSMNKPKPMMGCMRIGLNQVNFKPKTGEVYFLNYDRLVGDSGIKKGLIN